MSNRSVDPAALIARYIPEPFRYRAPADERDRDLSGVAAIFAPFARTPGASGSLQAGSAKLTIPALSGACGIEVRSALPVAPGTPLIEIGDEVMSSTGAQNQATNLVLNDAIHLHVLAPWINTIFLWRRPLSDEELSTYPELLTLLPLEAHAALRERAPPGLATSGLVAKERPLTIPMGPLPIPALVAGELLNLPVAPAHFEQHLKWLAPTVEDTDDVLAILYAYDELVGGTPLVDEGSVKVIAKDSTRFVESWRAPHFDDDELVFFAASHHEGLHEVRVHCEHYFVEVSTIDKVAATIAPSLGRALQASAEQNRATQEAMAVVAFERARVELQALGAPRELLARYRAAKRDEARHARFFVARGESIACFARPVVRALSFKEAAIATFLEAVLPESAAATLLEDEGLSDIAADERTHVELAWDSIRFCVERGGREVAEAVWRLAPPAHRARARALL